MLSVLALSLLAIASAYQPSRVAWHRPGAMRMARGQPVVMKGKGSRGMPGKATVGRAAAGGITKTAKKKFEVRDFNEKTEWTLVAEKDELGPEAGSTMAVAAGVTPQGQEYIWTLVRGNPFVKDAPEDAPDATCYATDGSCRSCLFPMTKGKVEREGEGYTITCGLCGTKYSLDDGKAIDFLPGKSPAQFAAKLANRDKEPTPCTVLQTRISQSGRCYIRLPDGTLPITRKRKEGTLNEFDEIGVPKGKKGFGK